MANDPQEMDEDLLSKISKIVDASFVEKVLRDSEKNSRIKVLSVSIKPATNRGDNYTSDMFRASLEYTSQHEKRTKTLIVKVVPLTEGAHQDLISKMSLFSTEISMMSYTLAQMNEILRPYSSPLSGRCLFTQQSNPPLLVMQDLAPLGFRMADRQAGLDMDHCLLAIRNLARFHASSVVLLERDSKQIKKYDIGLFNVRQPPGIRDFYELGVKQLAQEVATWTELDPKISKKIAKLADTFYDKGCYITACRDNEFNVLNHDDFWVNNMLFKYDETNRPVEHVFVDFQLCLYTSPGIDLNYFFTTSLTDETLMLHEKTLINEYTRTLCSTMKKLKCTTSPPNVEQVKDMVRDRALYGMIVSISILPLLLVGKEEAGDINEVLGEGVNPAYKGKVYKKAMTSKLPRFDRMGLLD